MNIDYSEHYFYRNCPLRTLKMVKCFVHPNNINRDSEIEIPKAWMPSSRSLPQKTAEGTVSSSNNANHALDGNPPIMSDFCDTPITSSHGGTISSPK